MQIILLEKVINLGNLGDVVKVKDGYARNFLIPKRMAKRATPAAMAEFEVRRIELEKIAADKLAAAQTAWNQLAGLSGKRLFGDSATRVGFASAHREPDRRRVQTRLLAPRQSSACCGYGRIQRL